MCGGIVTPRLESERERRADPPELEARGEIAAALDFVQDDDPAEPLQGKGRFIELREVPRILQVEERARSSAPAQELARQCGLAHLAGTQQGDDRALPQEALDGPGDARREGASSYLEI